MTVHLSRRVGEVTVAVDGDRVATVTLDAPERRNALTIGLATDLVAVFDELEARPDVGAVVVTGVPPAFCAGADRAALDVADEAVLRTIYQSFVRVRECPLPTVAAVGGPAVGAGLNLALACDLRVASRSARFDSRFARLGLHPGGGASWLLRSAAGSTVATAMLLFDQPLDGSEAARVGLAWRCVEDGDLPAAATALAAQAASVPGQLAARIKRTLRATEGLSHGESLEWELEHQVWSTEQPWYRDRVR